MNSLAEFSMDVIPSLLQISICASLVLLVILRLQSTLRKHLSARWRYAMWMVVVARMLTPWTYEIPVVSERLATPVVEAMPRSVSQQIPVSTVDQPRANVESISKPNLIQSSAPVTVPSINKTLPSASFSLPSTSTLVFLAWMSGALLVPGIVLLLHVRMIRNALKAANHAPAWIGDLLATTRRELGVGAYPTIHVTSQVQSPTLVGAIRPKILLPETLVEEATPEEMRLYLLHELSHLKSGDIWFGWLWCLALSVHWFNPLMWWAGTRIRRDRELACDESVLRTIGSNSRDDYASALLKAVSLINPSNLDRYRFGLAGIAENRSEISRRVEQILTPLVHRKRARVISALVATLVLSISFMEVVYITVVVDAQEEPTAQTTTSEVPSFMRTIRSEMKRVKDHDASGNVWKDKIDFGLVYSEWRDAQDEIKQSDLQSMIESLNEYASEHQDDEDYGWRIFHLLSRIAQDMDGEDVSSESTPSFNYLWEATLHYPHTRYSEPSKHSKFQHLVNEMAMRIWDRDGIDAAEAYLVGLWESDSRLQYFYDGPWQERMNAEGIPATRMADLRANLPEKTYPALIPIAFVLTPQGLLHDGKLVTGDEELKQILSGIEHPYDHYITLGVSTEEMPLKQFRSTQRQLLQLVEKLRFDHLSDIGVQVSDLGARTTRVSRAKAKKQSEIHVSPQGVYSQGILIPDPKDWLSRVENPESHMIVLRPDDTVPMEQIIDLMNTLRDLGFKNVSIATVTQRKR